MNMKFTEKEKEFITELQKLMMKYDVILSAEDDKVCIDIDYEKDKESIVLPFKINAFYDLDDLIKEV